MNYPVIIFDCDGVIIDSRQQIIQRLTHTVQHFNLTPPSDDFFRLYLNTGSHMMKGYLNHYYANQLSESKKNIYLQYYSNLRFDDDTPYEGIVDCVKDASQHHRLYLVSNRHPQESTQALKKLDLINCFSGIFGTMKPAFRPKPHEDMFLPILADCGDTPKTSFLMIGDTQADLLFSKKIGIDFAYCQYGHGDPSTILSFKPNYVVESPQSLHLLLESFQ